MTPGTQPVLNRRSFLAATVACSAAGCALLSEPPAPQLYVLRPRPSLPADLPEARWQLSVAMPDALESLNTARIALNLTPSTLDYFANAAWADRVPRLLQGHLVEAFERSGKIVAVDRDTVGLGANYMLQTDIRAFTARYDAPHAPPRVTVDIQAKLVQMPERAIVGAMNTTHEAMARANELNAIVLAFDEAAGAALGDIVTWTLRTAPTV